jgi:hypothetical protein
MEDNDGVLSVARKESGEGTWATEHAGGRLIAASRCREDCEYPR